MNIFVSGLNYKTTPLEIREKLSFNQGEQREALGNISQLPGVGECVLLSTCNRTEVYIYSEESNFDICIVEKVLCRIKDLNIGDFKKYFNTYRGIKAVKHLLKVACGLDSMVLGEDQILGQVKGAYELSLEMGTGSSVLNTLFRDAITAAKKVKTSTGLSKNPLSVGSIAVRQAAEAAGGCLEERCALIIGAGKIGSIALKNLILRGIGKIYITNRSHGKAEDMSKIYRSVEVVDYNNRYRVMNDCDIIISSTSSPHYTITGDMVEKHLKPGRERIFIDLAVPRDIDESIKEREGVKYFNLDDLRETAEENIDTRQNEALKAEAILEEFVEQYERWYHFKNLLPLVKEIQDYANGLIEDKVSAALGKLRTAGEQDREVVKASIANTVNEILNKFIYSVREKGNREDMEAYFRCLRDAVKGRE